MSTSVSVRLAELRDQAGKDPIEAREQAWKWIDDLGKALAGGRERALADLSELFAAGLPPLALDGPTEGRLVGWASHPFPDRALATVTKLWLPWVGKRFDAASGTGDNLMSGSARYAGKLLWPFYRFGEFEGKTAGFGFTTWVETGKVDPGTDVLVIDYASVPSNPRLVIRSIRDELVEVVPGANLGKMLWRSGSGGSARHTLLAYFALKSSQGT